MDEGCSSGRESVSGEVYVEATSSDGGLWVSVRSVRRYGRNRETDCGWWNDRVRNRETDCGWWNDRTRTVVVERSNTDRGSMCGGTTARGSRFAMERVVRLSFRRTNGRGMQLGKGECQRRGVEATSD